MQRSTYLLLALAFALFGCAKAGDSSAPDSIAPTVPAAWIAPEPSAVKQEPPSEDLVKSVQSAVQAHVEALDTVSTPKTDAFTDAPPSDYTPWHLDGMIGAFSIDVGGVFGTLVADGAAGVKITWQQKAVAAPQALAKTPPKTALHFRPDMTSKEVDLMLAPVVRMAKQTKAVRDTGALRRNLNRQGEKFLSMVRVLSTVGELPGWHIDGFQLGLFFTAAGNVTPVIGASGTMNIFFDWQVVPGASKSTAPLSASERKIQQSLLSFVRTVSEVLPAANRAASDIRKSGFEFQVFQVGLGMGVGGNIGIASAQASAVGRIIFKKDPNSKAPEGKQVAKLPVLRSAPNGTSAVYQIEAAKFQEGINRAVSMGNFFAANAAAMDSARWKCTEIELGFDTAISGDLALVTVTGIGLIRMGFERLD